MSMLVYFKGEQLQAPCCNRYEGGMRKVVEPRAGGGVCRPGVNEFLNVIVMEKPFNLPLMPSRDTYAKLIAHKKFILPFPIKEEECSAYKIDSLTDVGV